VDRERLKLHHHGGGGEEGGGSAREEERLRDRFYRFYERVPRAVSRSPFSIRHEQRDSNRRLIESPNGPSRSRRLRKETPSLYQKGSSPARRPLAVLPRSVSRPITPRGERGARSRGRREMQIGQRRLARTTKRRPLRAKLLIELFDCARATRRLTRRGPNARRKGKRSPPSTPPGTMYIIFAPACVRVRSLSLSLFLSLSFSR